jgi:uncharacterized membrane protein YjjB (DUF3815 family)
MAPDVVPAPVTNPATRRKITVKFLSTMFARLASYPKAAVAFLTAAIMVAVPSAALATETETEKGVHEIATNVSTEGVQIILAVLAALVALIVAVIVIPKAIGFIRRFV